MNLEGIVASAVVEREPSDKDLDLELARRDANDFCEYVLRDEKTNKPIRQTQMHRDWHQLIERHKRLVVWSNFESGKTSNVSVGRVLYEIGRNQDLRVVIVSNTEDLPKKIIGLISKYVEESEPYREVFPGVVKGEPWNTTELTVKRKSFAKDPTVQATSAMGHISGARIDLLIFDDFLDFENTRTPEQRKALGEWVEAMLFGRLSADARVWFVGNAWHPEDFMHLFARKKGVYAVRYPVMDEEGNLRWPEKWPRERIEQARIDMGPIEFARKMMCVARDDATARFHREWIELCEARGAQKTMLSKLQNVPGGCSVYTGVDLSVGKKSARTKKSDESSLFTILVHPNGDREVLCIESGKWPGPEIMNRLVDTYNRYQSIFFVESNAAQEYLVQFTQSMTAVPVQSFETTRENKPNPEFGVESIAAELAAGKWIIPSKGGLHPELQKWKDEMLYYSPITHTGDRLMACWIAREACRAQKPPRVMETGYMRLNMAV